MSYFRDTTETSFYTHTHTHTHNFHVLTRMTLEKIQDVQIFPITPCMRDCQSDSLGLQCRRNKRVWEEG